MCTLTDKVRYIINDYAEKQEIAITLQRNPIARVRVFALS